MQYAQELHTTSGSSHLYLQLLPVNCHTTSSVSYCRKQWTSQTVHTVPEMYEGTLSGLHSLLNV